MLDYSPRVKPRFWGLFSGRSLCVPQWIFSLHISLAEAKFYVRVFSPLSVGLVSQFLTFTLKEQFAFFPVGLKGNSCSFFSPFGLLRSFSALPFGLLRSVFVFSHFRIKGAFYVFLFKKLSPVSPEGSFPALQAWSSPLQALPGWCCSLSWVSTGFVRKP